MRHGELLDQPAGDARSQQRVAVRDHLHCCGELFGRHILEQEAGRAGAERVVDIFIEVERREDEDPDAAGALIGKDSPGRFDAIDAGHPDVHEHHIGLCRQRDLDCMFTRRCLADDLDVCLLMGKYPLPSVDVLRLSNDLGFALVGVAGMLCAALAVACLSVQGRAAGVFGRKTFVFGIVVAVCLLGALAFVPVIALLIWAPMVAVQWLRS